jgi:PAS domain S-box-containing protein
MAPDTILNFFLLGLAIYLIDKRTRKNFVLTQGIALVAFILTLWALIGYVYASGPLYQFPVLSPMAIHTAVTFLLITIAILLSRPTTGFVSTFLNMNLGGVIFRRLLPFGIGVPVITGFLRLQGQRMDLFKQEFGSALAIIFIISIFSFLMWWLAKSLNYTDQERKEAEKNLLKATVELKKSESIYRNLIENSGVVMFTSSADGYFTFASARALKLTGYTSQELLKMDFTQLIIEEHKGFVTEKYVNQMKNMIGETQIEFSIRTKEGAIKWVEQSAVLLLNEGKPAGFQCVVKDITERMEMAEVLKKYELELVQNQKRLQSILDNATSFIYIKDLEGRYVVVNKQFKEAFNVDEESVLGKFPADFMEPSLAKRVTEKCNEVKKTGKDIEIEEIIEMKNGNRHFLITKFPLLDSQNNIYGLAGIGTDITERALNEEQLKQSKQMAEDAKKLQEQFLANMSHEIRTPMNGIQGMTDLLLDTELTIEQKDFASSIKNSSDNLLVIINDILDFSKIQAGKLTIESIEFSLADVIHNTKAIFRQKVSEKNLYLRINIGEEIPPTLVGDPYRLNQILVNIIGNAVKFTNKGGITVDITATNRRLENLDLEFKVADTGIGIPKEKMLDIFESFTQATTETSRKFGGTGLGLAISRQLVELQGGSITCQSEINLGTIFYFTVPFQSTAGKSKLFLPGTDVKNYKSLFENKRFLVAEDNEVNQKVITHVLKKAGGTVDIANNGKEAIQFLLTNKHYDLVIMDLQMPEMDGHAATIYIRNELKLTLPIIAMTASALKGEKTKCLEIGMNDYLSKPFEINFLYKCISQLLGDTIPNPTSKTMETPQNTNDNLFDLSMLQEMDDHEYTAEILTIFLTTTPDEIYELKKACAATDFGYIYKIAHKIKGSAGLLQAERFVQVLEKLEDLGRNQVTEGLIVLAERAGAEYRLLETPLKDHLKTVQQALRQIV